MTSCFWCHSLKHDGINCKKRPRNFVEAFIRGVNVREKENARLREQIDNAECLIHLIRANLSLDSSARKHVDDYLKAKKALEEK